MGYFERTEFNSYNEFMEYVIELADDSECIMIQYDSGEKEIILFDVDSNMHKILYDNYSSVDYINDSNELTSFEDYPKEFYKSIDFIYCL